MPSHRETKILPYTSQQMFDLVADIESYPQFLPWCHSARIIRREDGKVIAELKIGYKMFSERFVSNVLLDRENKKIQVAYVSGPLKTLRNEWTFSSEGKKKCRIDFFVHFEFANPLLAGLMNMFFDVAFVKMVSSFQKRAAEIYA